MRNLLTYFRAQHALVGVCNCTEYRGVCVYVGLIAAAPAVGVALPQLDNKMQDTWACKLWKTPASSSCNGYWNAHTHTHREIHTEVHAHLGTHTYVRTAHKAMQLAHSRRIRNAWLCVSLTLLAVSNLKISMYMCVCVWTRVAKIGQLCCCC